MRVMELKFDFNIGIWGGLLQNPFSVKISKFVVETLIYETNYRSSPQQKVRNVHGINEEHFFCEESKSRR